MDLRPDSLTWTALLGRWMEFARASVALPEDAVGSAWRESIVPIIELQAVTFALGDLADLPLEEQPVALDKAEMLIDRARRTLDEAWGTGDRPASIAEIIRDARLALAAGRGLHAAARPEESP